MCSAIYESPEVTNIIAQVHTYDHQIDDDQRSTSGSVPAGIYGAQTGMQKEAPLLQSERSCLNSQMHHTIEARRCQLAWSMTRCNLEMLNSLAALIADRPCSTPKLVI